MPELTHYLPSALSDMSKLIEHGATTHPHDMEWLDHSVDDHLDHLKQHFTEFVSGNTVDKDSGMNQLVHIFTRAGMALEVLNRTEQQRGR